MCVDDEEKLQECIPLDMGKIWSFSVQCPPVTESSVKNALRTI